MKLPEIIGIAGTSGAGKDTTGHLLAQYGYKFTSVSDILRHELDLQGKPHTRENMRALSSQWHREFGAGNLSRKTIEKYQAENVDGRYAGLAIGSIRRPSEAQVIQEHGGIVLWLDAERQVRYQRIQAAGRDRDEDSASFEQWCADEDAEMTPPANDDGSALNMAGVRDVANVAISNSFEDERHFDQHIIELFELNA